MNTADDIAKRLNKSYGTQDNSRTTSVTTNDVAINCNIQREVPASTDELESQPLVPQQTANTENEYHEMRGLKAFVGVGTGIAAIGVSAKSLSTHIQRFYNGAFPSGCASAMNDIKNNCAFNSQNPFFIYINPSIDWQFPLFLYVPGAAVCLGLALAVQVGLGRKHPLAKLLTLLAMSAISAGIFTYIEESSRSNTIKDGNYWGYINCWNNACQTVCPTNPNCTFASFPDTQPTNTSAFFTQWPAFALTCGLLLISYITSVLYFKCNASDNNEPTVSDNNRPRP